MAQHAGSAVGKTTGKQFVRNVVVATGNQEPGREAGVMKDHGHDAMMARHSVAKAREIFTRLKKRIQSHVIR